MEGGHINEPFTYKFVELQLLCKFENELVPKDKLATNSNIRFVKS